MKKEILENALKSSKNMIIKGDIKSGKTRKVMFPIVSSLINNNENLLILDNKEEYLNNYYDSLIENNYNVVIVNLKDYSASEGFNPLEYPARLYKNGKKDEALDILEMLNSNIFHDNSESDPFWSLSASDFVTALGLSLFEDASLDEVNYKNISILFNECDTKFGASNYMSSYIKHKGTQSSIYTYASGTVLAPNETKGGILSTARQKLRLLTSRDELSKLMSKTTFNIDACLSKKTAIIIIAKDERTGVNKLASMLISEIYKIIASNKQDLKWNFILDNFDSIDYISNLNDMYKSSYVYNTKIYVCIKSLNELTRLYGSYISELADIIDANQYTIIDDEIDENYKNSNIKYPHPNIADIKYVKFIDILKKLKIKELVSTEDLINRIDKKLQELEEEK